jgi:hypothetical protein
MQNVKEAKAIGAARYGGNDPFLRGKPPRVIDGLTYAQLEVHSQIVASRRIRVT